jgi:hypothetical protein
MIHASPLQESVNRILLGRWIRLYFDMEYRIAILVVHDVKKVKQQAHVVHF